MSIEFPNTHYYNIATQNGFTKDALMSSPQISYGLAKEELEKAHEVVKMTFGTALANTLMH